MTQEFETPYGKIRAIPVEELRAALAEVPDGTPVILATDSEGNEYRTVADVAISMCIPEYPSCSWSVETYMTSEQLEELTRNSPELGYSDEDQAPKGAIRCVVIEPVN